MAKAFKIFDDAKDKNVANVVFYGDTTDNKLYLEATGATKTQVKESELQDAFLKGRLIIKVGDVAYTAASVEDNEATVITVSSNTVAAVVFAAKADE